MYSEVEVRILGFYLMTVETGEIGMGS